MKQLHGYRLGGRSMGERGRERKQLFRQKREKRGKKENFYPLMTTVAPTEENGMEIDLGSRAEGGKRPAK